VTLKLRCNAATNEPGRRRSPDVGRRRRGHTPFVLATPGSFILVQKKKNVKNEKREGGTATRLVLPLREGPEMPTTTGRAHILHPSPPRIIFTTGSWIFHFYFLTKHNNIENLLLRNRKTRKSRSLFGFPRRFNKHRSDA
jgi:hypothetical protein